MTSREQADAKKALGNEEFSNKNYEKSIEYYTEAIELDPSNHLYFSNRSAAYGALGNWAKAEEDAAQCVSINTKFAKGFARLANAQKHLGKTSEAVATLKKGQAVDSGNSEINRLLREMRKDVQASQPQQPRSLPPGVSKELEELQPQYKSVHRELEQIAAKLQGLARDRKRSELTRRDVADLPESTTMYRSVGKMFLQMTQTGTQEHLKGQEKSIDNQAAELQARKTYLERQKASIEENISELLAQC